LCSFYKREHWEISAQSLIPGDRQEKDGAPGSGSLGPEAVLSTTADDASTKMMGFGVTVKS
jgi:hypothetical protein